MTYDYDGTDPWDDVEPPVRKRRLKRLPKPNPRGKFHTTRKRNDKRHGRAE